MHNDTLAIVLKILEDQAAFQSEVLKFLAAEQIAKHNSNIFNYRIGDIVQHKDFGVGHIVGLDLNHKNEVVFEIQWADDEFGVCHLHPSNISRG